MSAMPAGAKKNTPKTAQTFADSQIASLLPSAGNPGVCDVKGQSGFFAKRKSYLASCSTTDGTLRVFVIARAANGGFKLNSSYFKSQLNDACRGNTFIYSDGVQGLFLETVIEIGDGQEAKGIRDLLASQLKGVKGASTNDQTC
jgi:hypothetical protein